MMEIAESRKPQLWILLLLVSFASVSAVLFTPALPSIASFFNVSMAQSQLTITAFLIGYALGQLPYGPLANRLGRKITLYIGISLAILGSLLCAFSSSMQSFELLVFARFLQALGACVGLKVSFTMIADVYNQTDATRIFSYVIMAFAIMPGLAIAVGGLLVQMFHWESCFYFLSFFGAALLCLSARLPETAKSLDRAALKLSSVIEGYRLKFKNQRLVTSAIVMGCGTAIVYIFAAKAPFIGITLMGMQPKAFGIYNLIPVLGMLLGAYFAAKLAGRLSVLNILLMGMIACLFMTLSMLIPFFLGILNPNTLFFPMLLVYVSESLIFANISSLGLSHAKNKSNGSAVLNFINLGIAVIAVLLLEFIYPDSALVMPVSFVVIFGIMILFWIRLKKLFTE